MKNNRTKSQTPKKTVPIDNVSSRRKKASAIITDTTNLLCNPITPSTVAHESTNAHKSTDNDKPQQKENKEDKEVPLKNILASGAFKDLKPEEQNWSLIFNGFCIRQVKQPEQSTNPPTAAPTTNATNVTTTAPRVTTTTLNTARINTATVKKTATKDDRTTIKKTAPANRVAEVPKRTVGAPNKRSKLLDLPKKKLEEEAKKKTAADAKKSNTTAKAKKKTASKAEEPAFDEEKAVLIREDTAKVFDSFDRHTPVGILDTVCYAPMFIKKIFERACKSLAALKDPILSDREFDALVTSLFINKANNIECLSKVRTLDPADLVELASEGFGGYPFFVGRDDIENASVPEIVHLFNIWMTSSKGTMLIKPEVFILQEENYTLDKPAQWYEDTGVLPILFDKVTVLDKKQLQKEIAETKKNCIRYLVLAMKRKLYFLPLDNNELNKDDKRKDNEDDKRKDNTRKDNEDDTRRDNTQQLRCRKKSETRNANAINVNAINVNTSNIQQNAINVNTSTADLESNTEIIYTANASCFEGGLFGIIVRDGLQFSFECGKESKEQQISPSTVLLISRSYEPDLSQNGNKKTVRRAH